MKDTAFITGASSGLGRETALSFANGGYRVFAGVRNAVDGDKLHDLHPSIEPVAIDLTDAASVREAAAEIDRRSGANGLAVLVNMAGYALFGPIEYTAQSDIDRLFDVLVFGPSRLTVALLPALRRHVAGGQMRAKVINVISWNALDSTPFVGFYAAAKAAFLRLSQAQFYELSGSGIDTVAVVPGLMRTPFVGAAALHIGNALAALPSAGIAAYGRQLQHMVKMSGSSSANRLAARPQRYAQRILAIAGKARPRFQYNFGFDTAMVALMNTLLPFRLLRAIKTSLFALEPR